MQQKYMNHVEIVASFSLILLFSILMFLVYKKKHIPFIENVLKKHALFIWQGSFFIGMFVLLRKKRHISNAIFISTIYNEEKLQKLKK